jgi:hypothetical protein
MEGNEVRTAGNGRVHYGFVGGERPSTGRRVCALYLGDEVRLGALETGRRGGEPRGLRRTRKEGTDVGWRLRADLHHDGDPSCARLGCGLTLPVHPGASAESQRVATATHRERREVSCSHVSAYPRRLCGPVDLHGRCDPVRVLVAGGQGQPCVPGSSRDPASGRARCRNTDQHSVCREKGARGQ